MLFVKASLLFSSSGCPRATNLVLFLRREWDLGILHVLSPRLLPKRLEWVNKHSMALAKGLPL